MHVRIEGTGRSVIDRGALVLVTEVDTVKDAGAEATTVLSLVVGKLVSNELRGCSSRGVGSLDFGIRRVNQRDVGLAVG